MKVLLATHNKAKYKSFKNILQNCGLEVICLNDLEITHEVEELANDVIENAISKAIGYYKLSGLPTISVDTGLELENIPSELQPGVHVRRLNGKDRATDEEVLEAYVKLVNEYGKDGKLNGAWIHGVAIAINENDIKTHKFKVEKIFVNDVKEKRNEGYPLDSMSICKEINKHTVDLTKEENLELTNKNNKAIFDFIVETLK